MKISKCRLMLFFVTIASISVCSAMKQAPKKIAASNVRDTFNDLQERYSLEGIDPLNASLTEFKNDFSALSPDDQVAVRRFINNDTRYTELNAAINRLLPRAAEPKATVAKKEEKASAAAGGAAPKAGKIDVAAIRAQMRAEFEAIKKELESGKINRSKIGGFFFVRKYSEADEAYQRELHQQLLAIARRIREKETPPATPASAVGAAASATKTAATVASTTPKTAASKAAAKEDFVKLHARQEPPRGVDFLSQVEILKNAKYIMQQLRAGRNPDEGLAEATYEPWTRKVSADDADSEAIKGIITRNRLIPDQDYTFIDDLHGMRNSDPDFFAAAYLPNMPNIERLKNSAHNFIHAFFVNSGGHWFTVIVHKIGRNFTYYVADDVTLSAKSTTYPETIEFLKRLIE